MAIRLVCFVCLCVLVTCFFLLLMCRIGALTAVSRILSVCAISDAHLLYMYVCV